MREKNCITLLAAVLMVGIIISSAVAEQQKPNFCANTSDDAFTSCRFGVHDDYYLALGKCRNLPTVSGRKACREEAQEEKQSGFEECRDQFAARQEVCRTLGKDPYDPVIDPANFVATIDNQFFPLTPGTTFIYEGTTEEGLEHIEVNVTHDTKVIFGVTCTAVRDTVTVEGELVEDTIDWYAQDTAGNVWYFGENSLSYKDGLIVSLEGSWMAGVDGAKPGIIMKGNPQVGDLYRQEFALGVAEDMGEVIGLNQSTTVPKGTYDNCVETKDFSPLEPDAVEHKFYAQGVGTVQEVDVTTLEHVDLITITTE